MTQIEIPKFTRLIAATLVIGLVGGGALGTFAGWAIHELSLQQQVVNPCPPDGYCLVKEHVCHPKKANTVALSDLANVGVFSKMKHANITTEQIRNILRVYEDYSDADDVKGVRITYYKNLTTSPPSYLSTLRPIDGSGSLLDAGESEVHYSSVSNRPYIIRCPPYCDISVADN